jgi:hypothetical protein
VKTLITFLLFFLLTITFLFLENCGGNETYERYIRAQVKIVTPTSEDSFSFDEPCYLFSSEIDQETYWEIDAIDSIVPFGIYICWKESFIIGPGTFQLEEGSQTLFIWLMRAHPTKPGWYRYSEIEEGSVTFTQIGYQSGDIIEGSFNQLYLSDLDVEMHIEVNNGTFSCRME